MKTIVEIFQASIPFAFAVYLGRVAISNHAPGAMQPWEPAFYNFLPMCFFFVGALIYQMGREIRELRGAVTQLQAGAKVGDVAA